MNKYNLYYGGYIICFVGCLTTGNIAENSRIILYSYYQTTKRLECPNALAKSECDVNHSTDIRVFYYYHVTQRMECFISEQETSAYTAAYQMQLRCQWE
jgi:hypothetical protein